MDMSASSISNFCFDTGHFLVILARYTPMGGFQNGYLATLLNPQDSYLSKEPFKTFITGLWSFWGHLKRFQSLNLALVFQKKNSYISKYKFLSLDSRIVSQSLSSCFWSEKSTIQPLKKFRNTKNNHLVTRQRSSLIKCVGHWPCIIH